VLDALRARARASGLREHLLEKGREHADAVGGSGHSLGAIGYTEGGYLYAVCRHVRPRVAVETGVANGFSTAFSLLALAGNGEGICTRSTSARGRPRLRARHLLRGRGARRHPAGSESGWLIPPELKERWTLVLGRRQDELPPLLDRLGTIDFFMHDSEHSFDCMWVRVQRGLARAATSGVLVSDDVNSTEAFGRFAREEGRARSGWPAEWLSCRSDLTS
jgi:hypothetical protein